MDAAEEGVTQTAIGVEAQRVELETLTAKMGQVDDRIGVLTRGRSEIMTFIDEMRAAALDVQISGLCTQVADLNKLLGMMRSTVEEHKKMLDPWDAKFIGKRMESAVPAPLPGVLGVSEEPSAKPTVVPVSMATPMKGGAAESDVGPKGAEATGSSEFVEKDRELNKNVWERKGFDKRLSKYTNERGDK